jgi:hypothetical protein
MDCKRCGEAFGCGAGDTSKKCWCEAAPPLRPIPTQYENCLCPKCLHSFAKTNSNESGDLIEGEDFYYEKNLMVFTEKYHLKKGHCCKNNCRHCPY